MAVPSFLTCPVCEERFRIARRAYNRAKSEGRRPHCSTRCAGIARRVGTPQDSRDRKNARRRQRRIDLKTNPVDPTPEAIAQLRDMVAVMIDLLFAIPYGVAEAEVMIARLSLAESETVLGRRYVQILEEKERTG